MLSLVLVLVLMLFAVLCCICFCCLLMLCYAFCVCCRCCLLCCGDVCCSFFALSIVCCFLVVLIWRAFLVAACYRACFCFPAFAHFSICRLLRMFGGLMAHLGRAREQLDHDKVWSAFLCESCCCVAWDLHLAPFETWENMSDETRRRIQHLRPQEAASPELIPHYFQVVCSQKHGLTGILHTAKNIAHEFQIVCPRKTSFIRYSTANLQTLFPTSLSSKTRVNRHTTYCKNDRTQIRSSLSRKTSANSYSTTKISHTNSK